MPQMTHFEKLSFFSRGNLKRNIERSENEIQDCIYTCY